MRTRVAAGDVDALIDQRIAACRRRNVPMLWWTGPSTVPHDLGQRLLNRGFLLEPAIGMAIALDAMTPVESALTIEPVLDREGLAAWSRVLCDAFAAPDSFGAAFSELAMAVGLGTTAPFRHFLGRLNGVPVATSSLFMGAGVAGIYDVSTLPERRRRGFGAAITRGAMVEARAAGCQTAILHSSALGAGMYRSLGFVDVCGIGQYVWAPEGFDGSRDPGSR